MNELRQPLPNKTEKLLHERNLTTSLNYLEKTNEFRNWIYQKIKFKRLFSYSLHKKPDDECSDGIRLPKGILNELDSKQRDQVNQLCKDQLLYVILTIPK